MFGMVTAHIPDLTESQRARYRALYCGICHQLGQGASSLSRMCLSYDLVFLALVLSSLYEPQEEQLSSRCLPHPFSRQDYITSPPVTYAAHMNLALAYHSADDHWQDDRRLDALALKKVLKKHYPALEVQYPRQCQAIAENLSQLHRLEEAHCANPDLPANTFGALLGELFVYVEDRWAPALHQLGHSLGRFIYLCDAAIDYDRDKKHGSYNPFLAAGLTPDRDAWEQYLTAELAACVAAYDLLPLVEDKSLMDHILYRGIWQAYRRKQKV